MRDKPIVDLPALQGLGSVLQKLEAVGAPLRRVTASMVPVSDMLKRMKQSLDSWEIVRLVVQTQSADDQEIIWDYMEEQYSDEAITLIRVLLAGKEDNQAEAGKMLLWLATYHKECLRAVSDKHAAPLHKVTANRQKLREEGITYAASLSTLSYKREFVDALVEKFNLGKGRAVAWLDFGIEQGLFVPPKTYSQAGAPKKK